MIVCPCCGQPTSERKSVEALKDAPLPLVARTIVRALVDAYPRAVTTDFLIEYIYGGSHEPEHSYTGLHVQINRLRRKLPEYGWRIPPSPTGRGNRGLYRLEPIS